MAKAEFVMKAHTYQPGKVNVIGWYMSEKLDGMRAVWDGGISRGMLKSVIPWANTKKDSRYKTPPRCTGLWTPNGHPIQAPDFVLDKLPKGICLDGELYSKTVSREKLFSIVKQLTPNIFDWYNVQYYVFDAPHPRILFSDRTIKTVTCQMELDDVIDKFEPLEQLVANIPTKLLQFTDTKSLIWTLGNDTLIPHQQTVVIDTEHIRTYMDVVTEAGGEGIMLRNPASCWHPYRSHDLLKYKYKQDMEGIVVGYISGIGKYQGMLGSLTVKLLDSDVTFQLSGFTNEERGMNDMVWCSLNPGEVCPPNITSLMFPRSSLVSFTYRELTTAGVPIEARYKRKRSSFGE